MTEATLKPEPYEFDGDELTVFLLRPFDCDGVRYTSVKLRELTVEENLELDKASANRSSFEQDVYYFAKMAQKPASFFMSMRERDWKRVKNAYWETLGNVELELKNFD